MKEAFLPITIVLMSLVFNLSCESLLGNPTEGRGLYIYSGKQLSQFSHDVGYPNFWQRWDISISRNSDGTALRFLHEKKKICLILTCDGTLQEIPIPGYPAWFNDRHQVVAWHDYDKALVHHQYGKSEKIVTAFGPYEGPDPSGTYFIKAPLFQNSCTTDIYSLEKPYKPLIKVPVCGPRRIFFTDNKICLFGIDYKDELNSQEDYKADITTAHVFQVSEVGVLTETETVKIRRPESSPTIFPVRDFSPWSDEVLFLDIYDVPSRSIWYVFNLKTGEMKKIGKVPSSGGWAFFLQCDILEEVRKNFQAKRIRK